MIRIDQRAARLLALTCLAVVAAAVRPGPAGAEEAGDASRRTSGSAFLVGSDGYLVTNAHVVATCDAPRYLNGRSAEPVRAVLVDQQLDLAILFSPNLARAGALALRTDTKLGEHVTVFGYPLAKGLAETGRPTVGVLLGRSGDGRRIMTNAQVQAGNSGGPVFDQTGAVVGVAFGKNVNRTFAMSASAIGEVLARAGVSPPMAPPGAVLSVADVVATARRFTGKIDCRG